LFPPKIQRTSAFQSAVVALFLICECKDSASKQCGQDFSEKSFIFRDFFGFSAAKRIVLPHKLDRMTI
jgi:hypothetical protein